MDYFATCFAYKLTEADLLPPPPPALNERMQMCCWRPQDEFTMRNAAHYAAKSAYLADWYYSTPVAPNASAEEREKDIQAISQLTYNNVHKALAACLQCTEVVLSMSPSDLEWMRALVAVLHQIVNHVAPRLGLGGSCVYPFTTVDLGKLSQMLFGMIHRILK
jgi:hypothetical protein